MKEGHRRPGGPECVALLCLECCVVVTTINTDHGPIFWPLAPDPGFLGKHSSLGS